MPDFYKTQQRDACVSLTDYCTASTAFRNCRICQRLNWLVASRQQRLGGVPRSRWILGRGSSILDLCSLSLRPQDEFGLPFMLLDIGRFSCPTKRSMCTTPLLLSADRIYLPPPPSLYIGGVGVGWQQRCKTRQSLRALGNQGAVLFVFLIPSIILAVTMAGGRLTVDHIVRGGEPYQLPSRSVYMVGNPRGGYMVYPLLPLQVATPQKQINSFDDVIHVEERPQKPPKSASQAVLSRMQLTFHATRRTPHGASRLVQSNVCLVGEKSTCSIRTL